MSQHRASWVAALAKLTTPHDAERGAAAMAAYMPFLGELPEQAFTLASMRHVAMQERRMMIPDLREVLEPLSAWWRDNGPRRVALPAPRAEPEPEREPPTAEQREAVARMLRSVTVKTQAPAVSAPRPNHAPPEQLAAARARLRGIGQ